MLVRFKRDKKGKLKGETVRLTKDDKTFAANLNKKNKTKKGYYEK